MAKKSIGALKRKADRLYQLHFVPLNPNCIVCGSQTSEMHHWVYKSQSSALRYDPDNLVPLCSGCHACHHRSGDPKIAAGILRAKGLDWDQMLQDRRREYYKDNIQAVRDAIERIA